MLSCKEATRLVSESLDRKLSFGQRLQLWLHLRLCALCSSFRKDVRKIQETLGQDAGQLDEPSHDPESQLSPEARARLRRALESRRSEKPPA